MDKYNYNPEIRSFTLNLDENGKVIPRVKPEPSEPVVEQAEPVTEAVIPEKPAAVTEGQNKVSVNDLITMLNNSVEPDDTDDLIPLRKVKTTRPQSKVLNPKIRIIPPSKNDLAETKRKANEASNPRIRVPILNDEDTAENTRDEVKPAVTKQQKSITAEKKRHDTVPGEKKKESRDPVKTAEPRNRRVPEASANQPRKPAKRPINKPRKLSATEYINDAATIVPQEELPSATHQAAYGTLPETVYTERMSHTEILNIISPEDNIKPVDNYQEEESAENYTDKLLEEIPKKDELVFEDVPAFEDSEGENIAAEAPQTTPKQEAQKAKHEADTKAPEEPRPLTKAEIIKLKREKRFKKKNDQINRISGMLLIAVLVLVNLFNLITPDKEKSENENRGLAQLPEFSISSVVDGSFMSNLSSYVADQFFNRDGWISLRLTEDELLGASESNGVYLGKKGYLIEIPDEPNYTNVDKNLEAINQFTVNNPDLLINMAIITNAVTTMPNYLPDNAPARDQRKDISYLKNGLSTMVNFIDTTDLFISHQDDYLYYRTDHHWTSLGAYYAFMYMAKDLGITEPVPSYHIYTVTDSFEGTMASTSGCHNSDYLDSIEIYDPADTGSEFFVSYDDTFETSYSLYQSEKLNEKDKYTVFLGGNHPKLTIKSSCDSGKVLLLIKDSYANSFVQFLTPYYEKIIMVDPRYYYDSVSSIIANEGVTDVLFLYNMNTYLGDTSLADVLV